MRPALPAYRLWLAALAVVIAGWGLWPAAARAGMISMCHRAPVFSGAAVNVVILPYQFDSIGNFSGNRRSGDHLGFLIQMDTLLGLLKYRSIGVVKLLDPESREGCDPRKILERILTRGPSSESLREGQGLILLWGRFFAEGDNLYVQSYLQFLRKGRREEWSLPWPGGPSGSRLRGALPNTVISFAPRQLTRQDLKALDRDFQALTRAYEKPSRNSPKKELNLYDHFGFYVTDARKGWMKIAPFGWPEGGGWIEARTDSARFPLRKKLPELNLVDALTGYLERRIRSASDQPRQPRLAEWVRKALRQFKEDSPRTPPAPAHALAELLTAFTYLNPDGPPPEPFPEEAHRALHRAVRWAPDLADLHNLAVMGDLARDFHKGTPATRRLEKHRQTLTRILSLAPDNPYILGNLQTLSERLLDRGEGPETAQLRQALKVISRIRSQPPAHPPALPSLLWEAPPLRKTGER